MSRVNKSAYYPCTRTIIVLLYGILTTSTALIAVLSPCEMHLPKGCQRVMLLVRVMLQGSMTEYYSAHDMHSTNEISNTAELYNKMSGL